MSRLTPEDLIRAYPEIDFLVAEGRVSSGYMISIHRAFYEWAADQLDGGAVLDAGCGTGFGTELLSRRAVRAVGIDLKDKLLCYGDDCYGKPGLDFAVMDVGRIGFADESFDVVVADELLEHLPDHRPFLDECMRVLKPQGTLICATVNRVHSFGTGDNPLNRNHFREYDAADFRAELGRRFERVELLGQGYSERFRAYMQNRSARGIEWFLMKLNVKHRIPAAWRHWVRSKITGVKAGQALPEEFGVSDRNVEQSLYLVALARRKRGRPGLP
jgi:ubiquinone/menaquinone biosynthesis C-methylase UbiE